MISEAKALPPGEFTLKTIAFTFSSSLGKAHISNTTGLPVTDGYIKIYDKLSKLKFSWDPSRCAVLPMLVNKRDDNGNLIRLIFSLQEMDETLKEGGPIPNFNLAISDF